MTILEMINEWKKGCSNASSEHPEDCKECTVALINAIEKKFYETDEDIVINTLIDKTEELSLQSYYFGEDNSGDDAVFITYRVKPNYNIKSINKFATEMSEELLKKGLKAWPYISFVYK